MTFVCRLCRVGFMLRLVMRLSIAVPLTGSLAIFSNRFCSVSKLSPFIQRACVPCCKAKRPFLLLLLVACVHALEKWTSFSEIREKGHWLPTSQQLFRMAIQRLRVSWTPWRLPRLCIPVCRCSFVQGCLVDPTITQCTVVRCSCLWSSPNFRELKN